MASIPHKSDFDEPRFLKTVTDLKESFHYHRKLWEFVKIANAVEDNVRLTGTCKGIGFGVGTEPLPTYFASKGGAHIVATDQPTTSRNAANWSQSNQIAKSRESLNTRKILDDATFNNLVDFYNVDMNYISYNIPYMDLNNSPASRYDFLWSSCALEHLGSIPAGLWFIVNSLALLKPGGVAVHTTEFNLSSNHDTNFVHENCIFRKQDFERLDLTLRTLGGAWLEPLDYTRGSHEYDLYVDPMGWVENRNESNPHLNLKVDGFDATSIILVIHKK